MDNTKLKWRTTDKGIFQLLNYNDKHTGIIIICAKNKKSHYKWKPALPKEAENFMVGYCATYTDKQEGIDFIDFPTLRKAKLFCRSLFNFGRQFSSEEAAKC